MLVAMYYFVGAFGATYLVDLLNAKLFQGVLALVAILAGTFVLDMVVISSLQQRSAQQGLFDTFREQLAEGTAPRRPGGARRAGGQQPTGNHRHGAPIGRRPPAARVDATKA